MLTTLDVLLIGIALTVMLRSFSKRWSVWRQGREEEVSGDWKGLLWYVLGHKRILKRRKRGVAHLMVFCGFLLPLIIIIASQFPFRISQEPSVVLSFLLDITGAALFVGALFFMLRRLISKDAEGEKKKVLFPIFLLIFISVTGFMAEGIRLKIVHAPFTREAPLGWIFSHLLPPSPAFMQLTIRIHFFAVLLFLGTLAFGPVRHLAVAPLNILYRRKGPAGAIRDACLEKGVIGADRVKDFSWKQLLDVDSCVSCGRCEERCPAFLSGKPLSPRKVIQDILQEIEADRRARKDQGFSSGPGLESRITEDELWSCTTCMACVEGCPIFIEPLDKIIELRRFRVLGRGALPEEARGVIRNLEIYGDVQGKGVARREEWAYRMAVRRISSGDPDRDVLLWVGCFGAFHPRYQEACRALASILTEAGVGFGILGKEEKCCGDPARRMGDEGLFREIARENMGVLTGHNVKKIITLCPHCFNTLKNEYPRVTGVGSRGRNNRIEVLHATQYVMDLIEREVIRPRYPVKKTVTVHDACYLGRGNRLYEPPRRILKSLPEIRLRELDRARDKGLCCGGGGGNMWMHENQGRRIILIRAEEVLSKGADLLATSCPYCMIMLEDGVKALGGEKPPQVMDIMEILAYSLGSMEIEG